MSTKKKKPISYTYRKLGNSPQSQAHSVGGVMKDLGNIFIESVMSPIEGFTGKNIYKPKYENHVLGQVAKGASAVGAIGTDLAGSYFIPGYGLAKAAVQSQTADPESFYDTKQVRGADGIYHQEYNIKPEDKWAEGAKKVGSIAGDVMSMTGTTAAGAATKAAAAAKATTATTAATTAAATAKATTAGAKIAGAATKVGKAAATAEGLANLKTNIAGLGNQKVNTEGNSSPLTNSMVQPTNSMVQPGSFGTGAIEFGDAYGVPQSGFAYGGQLKYGLLHPSSTLLNPSNPLAYGGQINYGPLGPLNPLAYGGRIPLAYGGEKKEKKQKQKKTSADPTAFKVNHPGIDVVGQRPESNIDWTFIQAREGFELQGYVPDKENSNSGVTIASGYDLGSKGEKELVGLPPELIKKLIPYLGLKKEEADKVARNLTISKPEALLLNEHAKSQEGYRLMNNYQEATGRSFQDLPMNKATAVASIAFQHGDLTTAAPKFWGQVIRDDWQGAYDNILDWDGTGKDSKHQPRRRKEATYLNPNEEYGKNPSKARDFYENSKRKLGLAYGGEIDPLTNQNFGYGGRVPYSPGGDLQEVNAGGSHEENPMGGVPVGPNASVEQGETIKGNFVFSDRIKVTAKITEEFALPKNYVGKTYADASKISEKYNKHNDHIDATTSELITARLTEAQEAYKEIHMPQPQGQPGGMPQTAQFAYGGRIPMSEGGSMFPLPKKYRAVSNPSVSKRLFIALQALPDYEGYKDDWTITGLTRDAAVNAEVGGKENTKHFEGHGMDVSSKEDSIGFIAWLKTAPGKKWKEDFHVTQLDERKKKDAPHWHFQVNKDADRSKILKYSQYEQQYEENKNSDGMINYKTFESGKSKTASSSLKQEKDLIEYIMETGVSEETARNVIKNSDRDLLELFNKYPDAADVEIERGTVIDYYAEQERNASDVETQTNTREQSTTTAPTNTGSSEASATPSPVESGSGLIGYRNTLYSQAFEHLENIYGTDVAKQMMKEYGQELSGELGKAINSGGPNNPANYEDFGDLVISLSPYPSDPKEQAPSIPSLKVASDPNEQPLGKGVEAPIPLPPKKEAPGEPSGYDYIQGDMNVDNKVDHLDTRNSDGTGRWEPHVPGKSRGEIAQRAKDESARRQMEQDALDALGEQGNPSWKSYLEYAPVAYNIARGLSKPASLDKNDYTYSSNVKPFSTSIEPELRDYRNSYASALDTAAGATSDAGSLLSSLGTYQGVYNSSVGQAYTAKRNEDARNMLASQASQDQAAQFNSKMKYTVDDWNQNSIDATRNHLGAAATQLGQIGANENTRALYDEYGRLVSPDVTWPRATGANENTKTLYDKNGKVVSPGKRRHRAFGGYFYESKNT